jgi:DNA polymerase-3 subunit epsilon
VNLAASAPPPERCPTLVSRLTSGPNLDLGYAVIDVETTGLDAQVHRIVECAIVELDPSGDIVDEWVSLVAIPEAEELGASFVHGITRSMLAGAPPFAELVPELVARLSGRVVVGHVLEFDASHLAAEFRRAGVELPDLVAAGLCTRDLARIHLPSERRSLEVCCALAGVQLTGPHTALGDARAAAGLLRWFIDAGHGFGWADRALAARGLGWPRPGPARERSGAAGLGRPDRLADPVLDERAARAGAEHRDLPERAHETDVVAERGAPRNGLGDERADGDDVAARLA